MSRAGTPRSWDGTARYGALGDSAVDLGVEFGRHERLEVVVRRNLDAAVLEGADVRLVRERVVEHVFHDLHHRVLRTLQHAREDDGTELSRQRLVAVAVDPDHRHAAAFECRRCRTLAHLSRDREDDVGALVDEALGERLALVDVLEVAGEGAILLRLVPAEDPDCRAMHLVVLGHAVDEAVHEEGHGRLVAAAERRHDAGLRDPGREIAGEVGGLRGVEHDRLHVLGLDRLVDDREVDLGVRGGLVERGVGELEAHGHDELATRAHGLLDVRRQVGFASGDECLGLDAELLLGLLQPLPARLVERAVLEASGVRDHAHARLRRFAAVATFGCRCARRKDDGCRDERRTVAEPPTHRHPLPRSLVC
jgi:hypothetical protein